LRISLRTKWTVVLLTLGALPITLLAGVSLRIQRRGLEDSERALGLATIDQAAEGFDRFLNEVAEVSHWTGRLLTEGKITDGDLRISLAREAIGFAPSVAQVAVYGADGRLIDAIRKPNAEVVRPPDVLPPAEREAAAGGGRWVAADWEDATSAESRKERPGSAAGSETLPVFPYPRYVERLVANGSPRGTLVSHLDGTMLSSLLASISQARFDDPRRILLLDRQFRVVAGGDSTREPLGKIVKQGDVFATAAIPAEAFAAAFALTAEYQAPDGEAMVATVRTLPARGWAVIVRRPIREAYAALTEARRGLLGAAGVFSVVALLTGIWLGRKNTAPVKSLVELTHTYADRHFEARSPVRSGDELETLGHSMEGMADSLRQGGEEILRRARVEANLSRFLPAAVAQSISTGDQDIRLGGERRAITVLFADVVSFTLFAESSPPERVVSFLNQLFTTLSEVVFRHHGTVDKFIGDCLMAVFGAPNTQPDHAARAVAAAEDMQRFVEAQAPAWKQTFGFDVSLGIGVSSGEAVVGNLGSETRMEYTAIGDIVNVAARLEGMARPGQTLVTAEVASQVGSAFRFSSLGQVEMRGKRVPVTVLELL
jgi:adenylate cyclase